MNHDLKIKEVYLDAKLRGDKLFEIRLNDRGYQKGDTATYTEIEKNGKKIKHRYLITYVCNYHQSQNYIVFGEKYIGTAGA